MLAPRPDRILSVAALSPSARSKVRGLLLFGRGQLAHPWRLADDHAGADAILWPDTQGDDVPSAPENSLPSGGVAAESLPSFTLVAPHWWLHQGSSPNTSLASSESVAAEALQRPEELPLEGTYASADRPDHPPRFKPSQGCPHSLMSQPELAGRSASCWPLGRLSSASLLPALDDLDSWISIQSGLLSVSDTPPQLIMSSEPISFIDPVRAAAATGEHESDAKVVDSDLSIHQASAPTSIPAKPAGDILLNDRVNEMTTEEVGVTDEKSRSASPAKSWLGHLVELANTPITLPRRRLASEADDSRAGPPVDSQHAVGNQAVRKTGRQDSASSVRLLLVGPSGSGKSCAIESVTSSKPGVPNGSGVASLGAAAAGSVPAHVTDEGLCRSGEARVWLSAVSSAPLNQHDPEALREMAQLIEQCDAVLILVDASREHPLVDLKDCLSNLGLLPDPSAGAGPVRPAERGASFSNGRLGYRPVLVAYTHLDAGAIPPGFRAALSELMGFQAPVLPMDPRDHAAVNRAVALLSGSALRARAANASPPSAQHPRPS